MKSVFENLTNITLCIYALSDDIYYEISDDNNFSQPFELKNPRVFISYTGLNTENRIWVKDFACKLRKHGVEARLDIFHLKPGEDLAQWMADEVIKADKVLLICDKYYAEKANNKRGGVGWETMIIQGDMLSQPAQNKYIAILRDSETNESLPIYIKSRYALDWSEDNQTEDDFNNLLLHLFDCDIEPPIGEIPEFVKNKLANKHK